MFFCKLMETLVRTKILDYLDANNLLSHSQWGLRPGISTLSQLLLAQSNLVECFNERACMDAVYTDLSKTFDCILHEKLLIKMYAYGINPNVCAWICDFLTNRRQRLSYNKLYV